MIRPARPVNPGRILQRELEARNWSPANIPNIPVNDIIQGTVQITPEIARELSLALGTTIEFWINLAR